MQVTYATTDTICSTQLIANLSNEILGVLSLSRRLRTSKVQSARDSHLHLCPEAVAECDERAKCGQSAVQSIGICDMWAVGLEHEGNVSHEDFSTSFAGV